MMEDVQNNIEEEEQKKKDSFLKANVLDRKEVKFREESRYRSKAIEDLFLWATERGASDITIQSGEQIIVEIYGKKYRVTERRLNNSEVQDIISDMYGGESAKAILGGDSDLDFAYEIKPDRFTRHRFRVNATGIMDGTTIGIQITARSIPSKPYDISTMNLEKDIFENICPQQGMIVVTGGTGSGKSTLLSSIIRYIAEQPEANKKILTYESPIEFVYDELDTPSTSIAQTEIPKNLPDFSRGTRNALRRKPDIILVGEARDAETIGEAVTASMTGHLLYTTVHSNGFADTIRRMVNTFPEGERNSRAVDIISSLRMVISQRLVPSVDGKRVALREYVIFNDDIVDYLLSQNIDNLTNSCRHILKKYGRSFLEDATQKYEEGKISKEIFKQFNFGDKALEKDSDVIKNKIISKAEKLINEEEVESQPGKDIVDYNAEPRLDFNLLGDNLNENNN